MKKLSYFLLGIGAFTFVACGGNTESTTTDESVATEDTATEEAAPAADETADANTIVLEGNDQMQFNKTEFTVKAGEVKITIKNVGSLPAEAMSHDVVVLKPGSVVKDFGMKAVEVGGIEKIDGDMKNSIVGYTEMAGPGEEKSATFNLSEPGVYPFFCSFPGHFAAMQGTITVE
ncbi:MAG: azurin [Flavobacteriia bacterium]|nr:azurin [Flavobacteriia bacterium]